MKIFKEMQKNQFEEVVFVSDSTSGLKAVIAIHDTTLGPALGGTRMWMYEDEEAAAVDAMRLARGMTYKAAVAGLNLGGGKAVIIGNPRTDKSEALFRAFGRYVQGLGGRYITAEDVGTCPDDMRYISMETEYVTGVTTTKRQGGDPSPATAFGVYQGMKAAANEVFGTEDLADKVIAVQGLGHVGSYLVDLLAKDGAKLLVSDINEESIKNITSKYVVDVIPPQEILQVKCDILAPCALGAVINDATVYNLNCKVIAGAANNVLLESKHGDILHEQGILYAPDYVINAGGLINVADELDGYDKDRAYRKIAQIYNNIAEVIAISKRDNIPTYKAADILAEERIERIARIKRKFVS